MSDSIISSLIASAIWGLLVVFFSPKIIKFLKKMIVSLMDSGSLFVFNSYNDEEFIKDFKHEMKKAKRLAICTSRGSFLMDPPYREYLNVVHQIQSINVQRHLSNQYLLPDLMICMVLPFKLYVFQQHYYTQHHYPR